MKKMHKVRSVVGALTAVAAMAVVQQAAADSNPFALSSGANNIVVADKEKGISVLKGKCGAGKCGTQRIRQMMDRNADGQINRAEFVAWAGANAGAEFDEMSKGAEAIGADAVFDHFKSLDFQSQG